jgi:hypothetical protein
MKWFPMIPKIGYVSLAQMEERHTENMEVAGSLPAGYTKNEKVSLVRHNPSFPSHSFDN